MGKLVMNDVELDIPGNWKDQGMVTLTLPSTDKTIRPNIIVTKERLTQAIDLDAYFEKIKQSVVSRGIQSFEIVEEIDLDLNGIPAKQMVCRWDLASMKAMAQPGQNLDHVKPGQMVQQIQVSLIRGDQALNFTASFPSEQFDLYSRPFDKFLQSLKFTT